MFQKSILAAALVGLPLAMSGDAKAQCGTVDYSNPGYSSTMYQAGYASYPSSYRTYRRYPTYSGSDYSPYRSRSYSPYRSYYSPYGYSSRRYPSRYSAGYRFYGPTYYGRGYNYGWPGYSYYGRPGISLYFGR